MILDWRRRVITMADTALHADDHAQLGHEPTDVPVRGILIFIGALTIFVILVTGAIWLLFNRLAAEQALLKQSRFPLAVADRNRPLDKRLPPEPRLEGLDPGSLFHSGVAGWPSLGPEQRQHDEVALSKYAWVDAKAGVAQIPIERAIDLLAGKLPVRVQQKDSAVPGGDNRKEKP
jgi:hypothetical protein